MTESPILPRTIPQPCSICGRPPCQNGAECQLQKHEPLFGYCHGHASPQATSGEGWKPEWRELTAHVWEHFHRSVISTVATEQLCEDFISRLIKEREENLKKACQCKDCPLKMRLSNEAEGWTIGFDLGVSDESCLVLKKGDEVRSVLHSKEAEAWNEYIRRIRQEAKSEGRREMLGEAVRAISNTYDDGEECNGWKNTKCIGACFCDRHYWMNVGRLASFDALREMEKRYDA